MKYQSNHFKESNQKSFLWIQRSLMNDRIEYAHIIMNVL